MQTFIAIVLSTMIVLFFCALIISIKENVKLWKQSVKDAYTLDSTTLKEEL